MTVPIDNKFVIMSWCAVINCNNETKNNREVF